MQKSKITQAVILAGGLGTRLKPYTETNPKPMYKFEGIPFLGYLLRQIKTFGIEDVLILLGYLPDKIKEYAGDGSEFGLHITYDITPVEFETGGRLKSAVSKLREHFLLLYCDNYCPVDFDKMVEAYFLNDPIVQITAYTNRDGYTKNNLTADETNRILVYDKSRKTEGLKMVDIGYALVHKSAVNMLPDGNTNFEAEIFPKLIKEKKMTAFLVEHRYYSIGSWERIKLTEQFFQMKKTIFLDRDGTLNVKARKAQYIVSPEQFVWIDKAKEAIRLLKLHGYTIILITNQPGVARRMVTLQMIEKIHQAMQSDLLSEGCQVDRIYICTHGWDEDCLCRKPKPGLLYQAQRELSLNLRECVLIGDDERDIEAGIAAGCKTNIRVTEEFSLYDAVLSLIRKEE